MEHTVYILGYIGSWKNTQENILNHLQSVFDNEKVVFEINSEGGSVFEGNAIYSYIKNLKNPTESRIVGFCASMATVIACATDKTKMASNALFMIHAPSTNLEWANLSQLKEETETMEKIETIMLSIYSKKTGQTTETLRKKYFDGKDHYLTAQEAKDEGFIDEVIEDVFDIPMNIAASANTEKKNYFISQSTKPTEKVMEKPLEKIAAFVGAAQDENAILEKLKADRTEKMEMLKVVAKSKGFDDEKIALLELADYDKAKQIVMNAKAVQPQAAPTTPAKSEAKEENQPAQTAAEQFNAFGEAMKTFMANAPKTEIEDREKWTMNDWQENDPKGLLEMHDNEPKKYAALAKTYTSPAAKKR